MLGIVQQAAAGVVAFAWDAVDDSRVNHYQVHYGRETGNYDSHVDTTATSLEIAQPRERCHLLFRGARL